MATVTIYKDEVWPVYKIDSPKEPTMPSEVIVNLPAAKLCRWMKTIAKYHQIQKELAEIYNAHCDPTDL